MKLEKNKRIRVSIDKEVSVYELEDEVRWPCFLKVHQTVAEIKFTKNTSKLWGTFGKKLNEVEEDTNSLPEFCEMKVVHSSVVTHDTKLIALQYTEPTLHHVHVGHHVQIKDNINGKDYIILFLIVVYFSSLINSFCLLLYSVGEEVRRSYTPVLFLIRNSNLVFELPTLYFLIKEYSSGKLSRKLCSLDVGDTINMSYPRGTFNTIILKKRLELILLAAGTGITPMTSLISWTLNATRLDVKLIYFNKTEIDILWRKQFDKLASENSR